MIEGTLSKDALIEALNEIVDYDGDEENWHYEADELLLKFINDVEISNAFYDVPKRYA